MIQSVFVLNITTNTGRTETIVYDTLPTASISFESLHHIPLNTVRSIYIKRFTNPMIYGGKDYTRL